MRIAVVSDIHGNVRAFEQCLYFLHRQKIDRKIFLGDAVGYLPFGLEVLKLLEEEGFECIRGNHEAMLTRLLPVNEKNEEVYKLELLKNRMQPEVLKYIDSWNDVISMEEAGRKYLFLHGSPEDHLTGYVYPDTDLSVYADMSWDVIVMGHTHYPFLREEYEKVFINPGSVGLPRDAGGLSSLAIIETQPFAVMHYRLKYDVEEVLSEIDKEHIHEATVERLRRDSNKEVFGTLVNN